MTDLSFTKTKQPRQHTWGETTSVGWDGVRHRSLEQTAQPPCTTQSTGAAEAAGRLEMSQHPHPHQHPVHASIPAHISIPGNTSIPGNSSTPAHPCTGAQGHKGRANSWCVAGEELGCRCEGDQTWEILFPVKGNSFRGCPSFPFLPTS